jgi:hypothetical protein
MNNIEINDTDETLNNKIIIKEDIQKDIQKDKIKNKGTGAGGANTNLNGLSYEEKTNLENHYKIIQVIYCDKKNIVKKIKFIGYEEYTLINANKVLLYKYMIKNGEKNNKLKQASGCKEPDEAYIDENRKIIYIIEKKFQQTSGSVDEKIQTGPFKKLHYGEQFPNYIVHYIYCLSDWFKQDEYNCVLEYLTKNNIQIFWGNDENYKNDIIKFMCT